MTNSSHLLAATALLGMALALPCQAAPLNDAQKKQVEEIIRSYLLNNPELLREMADKLDAKDRQAEEAQREKALVTHKDEIFKSPRDPLIGNPKGGVTVVEFIDYNCSWCKKAVSEIATLVGQDKDVKVVFKEFPIFGEHSEYASRAALAAGKQNKYWELHQALFTHDGQVTIDVVNQLAEAQGLDMARLKADIESSEIAEHIAANMQLAKNLVIAGTPAFIIDNQVFGGYLTMDKLNSAIASVRANGCKLC